jgi:hypothetical protein
VTDVVSALADFNTTVGRSGGDDRSALVRLKASF